MRATTDTTVTSRGGAAGLGAALSGIAGTGGQPGTADAVGEPSAEIKELMTRFYLAMSQGDFEVLERLLSRRAGMLWIGTDPRECWDGPDAALQAWRAQTAELGGAPPITGGNLTAYQRGEVAWVADDPVFRLPDDGRVQFRLTAVWVREPEGWRIVQVHTSIGVANESVLQPGR